MIAIRPLEIFKDFRAPVVSLPQICCGTELVETRGSRSLIALLVLCTVGFDSGDVAERMAAVSRQMGYLYETGDIRRKLVGQFKWTNFRNDVTSDVIFGSTFADRQTELVDGDS